MTASPTTTWGAPPPSAPPSPQPTQPPKPSLWRRPWAVGVAGLLVGFTFGAASNGSDPAPQPRSAVVTPAAPVVTDAPVATEAPAPQTTEAPAPAEPTYATPKPSDFTLTVKTLTKENFGSAGSLVTFRINAGWSKTYDPDKTYEVVYEVRGTEDGPMVNTFTVTGEEYERPSEESASTSSVSSHLTAKVTSVEEV